MATQKESPVEALDPIRALENEVNRLVNKVAMHEKELRQARADERRARAALFDRQRQQEL